MKFAYLIEPPFNDRAPNGDIVGCDVELARHVCAEIGESFEPVETEFAALLPGVARGDWRMTTGLFATEERRRAAAFSRPVWALPDGFLVRAGDRRGLEGYRSAAAQPGCRVAVIKDQFQHRTAVEFGVPEDRILIFETYAEAADAVASGRADAYASVARAHAGHIARHPDAGFDVVTAPSEEKPPAFGCFAFALGDDRLRREVDQALAAYLGSPAHRSMMAGYGFSDAEVDLVAT